MRRRLTNIGLAICIVALFATAVSADSYPEVEAPCPLYGVQMVSQGIAYVNDAYTEDRIFGGGWYECDCGERFACEGYPHFGGSIYSYITEGAILTWDSYGGVTTFWVDPDLVYYTTSSTLDGYGFLSALAPPSE